MNILTKKYIAIILAAVILCAAGIGVFMFFRDKNNITKSDIKKAVAILRSGVIHKTKGFTVSANRCAGMSVSKVADNGRVDVYSCISGIECTVDREELAPLCESVGLKTTIVNAQTMEQQKKLLTKMIEDGNKKTADVKEALSILKDGKCFTANNIVCGEKFDDGLNDMAAYEGFILVLYKSGFAVRKITDNGRFELYAEPYFAGTEQPFKCTVDKKELARFCEAFGLQTSIGKVPSLEEEKEAELKLMQWIEAQKNKQQR